MYGLLRLGSAKSTILCQRKNIHSYAVIFVVSKIMISINESAPLDLISEVHIKLTNI